MGTFGLTLLFACHNSIRFLIIGGRWRKLYLSAFYVLTIIIAALRTISFIAEFKALDMLIKEGINRDSEWQDIENSDQYGLL